LEGLVVGEADDGLEVGIAVGLVDGLAVGMEVGTVGLFVGATVGFDVGAVGLAVVGLEVGLHVSPLPVGLCVAATGPSNIVSSTSSVVKDKLCPANSFASQQRNPVEDDHEVVVICAVLKAHVLKPADINPVLSAFDCAALLPLLEMT